MSTVNGSFRFLGKFVAATAFGIALPLSVSAVPLPTTSPTVFPTGTLPSTPYVTPTPQATPSFEPTPSFTPTPNATPTSNPTVAPTMQPTSQPTAMPSPEEEAEVNDEVTATNAGEAELGANINKVTPRDLKNAARDGVAEAITVRRTEVNTHFGKQEEVLTLVSDKGATALARLEKIQELLEIYKNRRQRALRAGNEKRLARVKKNLAQLRIAKKATKKALAEKESGKVGRTRNGDLEAQPVSMIGGFVEVIAKEFHYGMRSNGQPGPEIPVQLDCVEVPPGLSRTEQNLVALFDGEEVQVGDVQQVVLGVEGSTISFGASMAFPTFLNPSISRRVESNDEHNTLILLNGDNLAEKLLQKGAHAAYGSQESLTELLANYLDSSGDVILPDNQMLILYELGGSNRDNPSFDFQDLVLLVEMETVIVQDEVVTLVNRIDPNGDEGSGNSDGQYASAMWEAGHWRRPGMSIPFVSENGNISRLRMVIKGEVPINGSFDNIRTATLDEISLNNYHLEIYQGGIASGQNSFWANPERFEVFGVPSEPVPDLRYDDLPSPTITAWGISGGLNALPTYLIEFDLDSLDISLTPGTEYILVVTEGGPIAFLSVLDSLIKDPVTIEDVYQAYDTPPMFYSGFGGQVTQMSSSVSLRVSR